MIEVVWGSFWFVVIFQAPRAETAFDAMFHREALAAEHEVFHFSLLLSSGISSSSNSFLNFSSQVLGVVMLVFG